MSEAQRTIRLYKKTIGIRDSVELVLNPADFLAPPKVPEEILRENLLIHHAMGCDNTESLEFKLKNGWMLRGVPDAWHQDKIVELKVVRPHSDKDKLLRLAAFQGMIYALAAGLDKVEVWLYYAMSGDVQIYSFNVDDLQPGNFFNTLEHNLWVLQQLQKPNFEIVKFKEPPENKLSMRMVKMR